jgi:Tol biopolymer transport system component
VGVAPQLPGHIALSPDGRVLAYGFNEIVNTGPGPSPTQHRVVFINIRSGRVVRSIVVPRMLIGPIWGFNGRLLFVSFGAVEATRSNGSHVRQIKIKFPGPRTANTVVDDAAVSPDGAQLAVTGVAHGGDCHVCQTDIYVVKAAGGKARRLTRSGQASNPVWSPDGRKIAFQDVGNKILTVATGHVGNLVTVPLSGGVVDWQARP